MKVSTFQHLAAAEIDKLRRELQILVGTDQITPETARIRLDKLKADCLAKEIQLRQYVERDDSETAQTKTSQQKPQRKKVPTQHSTHQSRE